MIIRTFCQTCWQPFEILASPEDIELVKGLVDKELSCRCPRLCGGKIFFTNLPIDFAPGAPIKPVLKLTGKELYRAVHGAGLPDELPTSKTALNGLLGNSRVESFGVEEKNGRFYLHELVFLDGTIVHLTSGQYGAQVLKITQPRREQSHGG